MRLGRSGLAGRCLRAIRGAPGLPAFGILPPRTRRPRWSVEYPLSLAASVRLRVVSSLPRSAASSCAAQDSRATAGVSPPYSRSVLACVRQVSGRISMEVQSIMSLSGLHERSWPTRSQCSLPLALGISPKCVGQLGIPLAAPDGALDEIDAASQVGESGGSRDTVDGG